MFPQFTSGLTPRKIFGHTVQLCFRRLPDEVLEDKIPMSTTRLDSTSPPGPLPFAFTFQVKDIVYYQVQHNCFAESRPGNRSLPGPSPPSSSRDPEGSDPTRRSSGEDRKGEVLPRPKVWTGKQERHRGRLVGVCGEKDKGG